jgi:large subunit ribosomal protein L16
MLMPRKTKYRKQQRGRRKGLSKGCLTVAFGDYGLRAEVAAWMTAQQIESMRVTMSRKLKKEGRFFLRVFPDKPVTKKPAETRMGKGKGSPDVWVAVVKRGRIICEVGEVTEEYAREIFRLVTSKLPMKVRMVKRTGPRAQEYGERKVQEEVSVVAAPVKDETETKKSVAGKG